MTPEEAQRYFDGYADCYNHLLIHFSIYVLTNIDTMTLDDISLIEGLQDYIKETYGLSVGEQPNTGNV